jgi:hypothetical protein
MIVSREATVEPGAFNLYVCRFNQAGFSIGQGNDPASKYTFQLRYLVSYQMSLG